MGPVKLHEWRAFLGLAPHSTNIAACAHDHYNHCSSISSLILEDNNLALTLVRAQSVHSPCTVRAQSVHSPCIVRAQSVHSPCTARAQSVHSPCTFRAQPVHTGAKIYKESVCMQNR